MSAEVGQGQRVRWFEGGHEIVLDPRLWSVRLAEFLGCGFRVVVPACADDLRSEAVAFAQAQVREIADLLGATLDEAPFEAAQTAPRSSGLLLEGGWEPVFRGPLGPQLTRISPVSPAVAGVSAFRLLPWAAAVGSPLARLPVSTVQADGVARRHLETLGLADAVGLWPAPQGQVASSTAGTVFHRDTAGAWRHTAAGPGTVASWLGERVASTLGSTATLLRPGSLAGVWAAVGASGDVRAEELTAATELERAVAAARHSL